MKVQKDGTLIVTAQELHADPAGVVRMRNDKDVIVVDDETGRVCMHISKQRGRLECTDNEALHQAGLAWNRLSQEDRITARAVLFTNAGKWIDPVLAFIQAAENHDD